MAEQKSEDTKNPAAPRRGARPFIGPAGAPGQRPAPLRPPVAGVRPARGPFVPAPLQPGRALGAVRPEGPIAPASVAPLPSLPEPPVQATALPAIPAVEPSADATEWWVAGDVAEAPVAPPEHAAGASDAEASLVEGSSADVSSGHAIANERFAAFDAEWYDPVPDAPLPADPAAPTFDVATLGSATASEQMWAEDIAAEASVSPVTDANTPAWLLDDDEPASVLDAPSVEISGQPSLELVSEASTPAPTADPALATSGLSVDGTWTEDVILPSAESLVGDHVAGGDVEPATPSAAASATDAPAFEMPALDIQATATWPDQLIAEYAPYVPTPVVPSLTGADFTNGPIPAEAMAEEAAEPSGADALDVEPAAPGLRVSAALNRLAERIRDGEIDVSSIAPDASDAAVLASVLAALLGGGSSSSR